MSNCKYKYDILKKWINYKSHHIQDPERQIEYFIITQVDVIKDTITQEKKNKTSGKEDYYNINKIYKIYGKKKKNQLSKTFRKKSIT